MVNPKFLSFIFLFVGHFASGQVLIDSSLVHLETIIYFESNESTLSNDDKSEILKLLDSSKDYSNYKLWVDAHTDDVGSTSFNLELSEKRKNSVVEFLISQSVPSHFIESDFHGESLQIALEQNKESRKLNRRAVLQLITKKQFLYLRGTIVDEETQKGITAQIQITGKDFEKQVKTDSSGKFKILSPLNKNVAIEVVAKDYFLETKKLLITEKHKDIKLKIPLPSIEIGKTFKFENMLFEGDRSIMLPSSISSLEHLKRCMTVNDEVCFEIAGHVNVPNEGKVSKKTSYYRLSVARALAVFDALFEIGVDSTRMLARGYGNWEMIYPVTQNENQMKFNRRVEIIISECDSTALIQNHSIPDKYEFMQLAPHQRKYADQTFKIDTKDFPPKAQKDLREQVDEMKKRNLDPTLYTYRELLMALPGPPDPK